MFGCQPDDQICELAHIGKIKKASDVGLYDSLKSSVVGLAVNYPLNFMKNEDLRKMKYFNLGIYIVPDILFT